MQLVRRIARRSKASSRLPILASRYTLAPSINLFESSSRLFRVHRLLATFILFRAAIAVVSTCNIKLRISYSLFLNHLSLSWSNSNFRKVDLIFRGTLRANSLMKHYQIFFEADVAPLLHYVSTRLSGAAVGQTDRPQAIPGISSSGTFFLHIIPRSRCLNFFACNPTS